MTWQGWDRGKSASDGGAGAAHAGRSVRPSLTAPSTSLRAGFRSRALPTREARAFVANLEARQRRVINASQKHEASRGAPGSFARQEQKRLAQDDNPIIRAANDLATLGMTNFGEVYSTLRLRSGQASEVVPFHSET
jgi:hypothetical protein